MSFAVGVAEGHFVQQQGLRFRFATPKGTQAHSLQTPGVR
jgi:hypothetical protein